MAEKEFKKVALQDVNGNYIAPVSYSAVYDKDGDVIDISSITSSVTSLSTGLSGLRNVTYPNINVLAGSGTIQLTDNSVNVINPTGAVTFRLPSVDNTNLHQILVQINMTTVYSISVGTTSFFNKKAPNLSTTGLYNMLYEWDRLGGVWVCGTLKKGRS